MEIADGIVTGVNYYFDRTDGWVWITGETRWWEIFVEFTGFNGAGGAWIVERWRWNGSSQFLREQPKTLGWAETQTLIDKVREHLSAVPVV